jgi:hypothetical protein
MKEGNGKMSKQKKKMFIVEKGESISSCLDRMADEGYLPVRRMEEPVFKESESGKKEPEYFEQKIQFEGKLM